MSNQLNQARCAGRCKLSLVRHSWLYWATISPFINLWRDLHPQTCHLLKWPLIRYFTGFGEHGNSTDILSKALSRCVCCVPPHKLLSRRPNGLRCSDNYLLRWQDLNLRSRISSLQRSLISWLHRWCLGCTSHTPYSEVNLYCSTLLQSLINKNLILWI